MKNLIEKVKGFFEDFTIQKKIGVGVAAAVLLAIVIVIVVLTAGGGRTGMQDPSGTYTVEVITEGGKALEEIRVNIYKDASKSDLVNVGKTDETGKISFESENAIGCVIVLEDVPAGYVVADTYEIESKETIIELEIELLSADDLSDVKFELGGVFADLTVEATDGNTYKISELLEEKKAVVLNFWYLNCGPCKQEFPFLQEAYANYKDDIEVLALNPLDGTNDTIKAFAEELGLTFPMASCDAAWEQAMQISAYPTTVVIDRFGTIAFIHKGYITETAIFETIFSTFIGEDYKQTTYKSVDEMMSEVEGNGSKEHPFEQVETKFDAEVEGGKEVYYQMYKVDGMILTIKDEDAYVVIGEDTYKAEDGVVTVELSTPDTYTPAVFGIGNAGSEKKTFKVTVDFKEGSTNKPYEMTLGEFEAKVEANNEQGIYYLYKATESGTLTVTCLSASEDVKYLFSLYNLNTYAMKNSEEEGAVDEDGKATVSIVVNKDDEVQFSVGTLPNEDNEYPAGEFKFEASFVEGEGTGEIGKLTEYAVTVKDANGNAVSGATVNFSGKDEDSVSVVTDASGVAKTSLKAGDYTVIVSAPNGYKMDSTEYKLTATKTTLTVTLEKKSTVTKTYTVKVVDESGNAISGALVTVGSSYGTTDGSGNVSFTLLEDNYTASADKAGYATASKAFGGSTSVTITLKKSAEEEKGTAYSVTVVDYAGNPIKDAAVNFLSGGKVVKTAVVAADGVATTKLDPANYTVEILFPSGKSYGFDDSNASLSASQTSTKIIAAPKVDESDTTSVYDGEYIMQNIYEGGTYIEIQSNANNFFVFSPTTSGKYTFRVSNPNMKIEYCGATSYFNETPSYPGEEISLDVYRDQIGNVAIVISVTGTSEGILIAERTGKAGTQTSYTEYKGTTTPTTFTLPDVSGKTLKHVDVTGTFKIVKGSDGYYHKDSATGPVVYVTLYSKSANAAQYISMQDLLSYGPLRNADKGEEYTNLMLKYVECVDATYGVYPLTDDLKHMFLYGGKAKGWYDKDTVAGFYLFGDKSVNKDIAWMFECCYFE